MQALLTLMDSPLNKAGYLQVYVRTESGILIEINTSLRELPTVYPISLAQQNFALFISNN